MDKEIFLTADIFINMSISARKKGKDLLGNGGNQAAKRI